jgi:hypothetical protein
MGISELPWMPLLNDQNPPLPTVGVPALSYRAPDNVISPAPCVLGKNISALNGKAGKVHRLKDVVTPGLMVMSVNA